MRFLPAAIWARAMADLREDWDVSRREDAAERERPSTTRIGRISRRRSAAGRAAAPASSQRCRIRGRGPVAARHRPSQTGRAVRARGPGRPPHVTESGRQTGAGVRAQPGKLRRAPRLERWPVPVRRWLPER